MIINDDYKDIIGTVFLALGIIMLGYMLVSPYNHMIIHVDEYFTVSVLHFPITDLIQVITRDVHPPFHYLLLKVITDILTTVGIQFDKIFIYKVVSIIPYAIILVMSATKIKNEYGYLTAGLFAFAMAVMSEFLAYYSVMRMYSWAMLFVILAFIFLRDVIDKNDAKSWAFLTIFSVLAAYTQYFAAIPIVCIYLSLFVYLFMNDKEKLKYWIISVVAGIVLFAPWLFSFMGQVAHVSGGYWIPKLTFKQFIGFFGYFVTSSKNLYTCIFSIVILAGFLIFSLRRFGDMDKKDKFYILCGIVAYFGTIAIGAAVSIVRPIMIDRYLLPSAAILWFTISLIIGKIDDKKEFIISFVLILLLLLAGISQLGSANEYWSNSNTDKEAFFDQISHDNNTIVINHPNNRMFYMEYSNSTEMYLLNPPSTLYGYNLSDLHDIFDFKEISKDNVSKLIEENPDKDIYIIYHSTNFDKHIKTKPIIKNNNVAFLKVQ